MSIDTSSQEIQLLLRQFEKGNVVLFAGAGFSIGARNSRGTDPPLATQLCEILAAECCWRYGGEELPVVFDQARKHLGTEGLNELLDSLYANCAPASWHSLIPQLVWYRIYTTNIDDVIENAYRGGGVQNLRPLVFPCAYQDPDIWFQQVQCTHLHGCVTDPSRGFTFTYEEFASLTATANPWYQALVDDMQSKSFLFVGTRLNEAPFFHYLNLRSQRARGVQEVRAKAFVVAPEVSPIGKRQLEDQNFVVIEATTEDFFNALNPEARERIQAPLDVVKNRYPHQIAAIEAGTFESQAELLRQFELVSTASGASARTRFKTAFFEGAEPNWEDIRNSVDAPRECVVDHLERLKAAVNGLACFAMVGHAGSGKSTVLRRLAFELTREGHTVYFLKSPHKLETQPLLGLVEWLGTRHVYMFLDDAMIHMETLSEIAKDLPPDSNVTFVLGDRPHVVLPRLSQLQGLSPVVLEMPYLTRPDCERILDRLDQFGFLGALQGKNRYEQLREFLGRSRKQLLVAMKEATAGRGFDVILLSEFQSLASVNARLAYTICSLAYMHGAPVQRRHLVACMDGTDLEKASVLANELKEVIIPWRESRELLIPRHRVIAHQIATETAPFHLKQRAVLSYLSQISGDITPQMISRRSPEYIGYRGVINFDNMVAIFGEDYEMIDGLYNAVKSYYSGDFLFWLQFGRAEIYFDQFVAAENYLNQSLGIRETVQARHHLGVLFLKRASFEENPAVAASDLRMGEDMLRAQIRERGSVDAYPYAALVAHKLRYLQKRGSERIGAELEELYAVAQEGLRRHPLDDAMKEAHNKIYYEYLMQTVRDKQAPRPEALSMDSH